MFAIWGTLHTQTYTITHTADEPTDEPDKRNNAMYSDGLQGIKSIQPSIRIACRICLSTSVPVTYRHQNQHGTQ